MALSLQIRGNGRFIVALYSSNLLVQLAESQQRGRQASRVMRHT